MLSKKTPATLVAFDMLVDSEGDSMVDLPLDERRKRLEQFYASDLAEVKGIALSRFTHSLTVAQGWLESLRGQLDGVVAKRRDESYLSGERAMRKIKVIRSADCVVGGFRYASAKPTVGSLLLGLYDGGLLHHVGFTSSMPSADRKTLTGQLESLIELPGFSGRAPGGPSRWSTERSAEWQPLRPELVVEVTYDHFSGGRFRHGTRFMRWRPDKAPASCTMKQVESESKVSIAKLTTRAAG
jgi:ATP-dependent DNA ligase